MPRGNPNWGKPVFGHRARPTYFEMFVEEHKIPPEQWASSPKVRAFVNQHKDHHYVPEDLLVKLGMNAKLHLTDWEGV